MNLYDLNNISKRTGTLDTLMLNQGDVLISTDGTIGRIGLSTNVMDGWAGSNNIGRVTCNNATKQNGYVAAFLMSPYGQHQLTREIYGGVVDHIDVSHIQEVIIPDAPVEVQQSIGELVVKAFEDKDQASLLEKETVRALEGKIVDE